MHCHSRTALHRHWPKQHVEGRPQRVQGTEGGENTPWSQIWTLALLAAWGRHPALVTNPSGATMLWESWTIEPFGQHFGAFASHAGMLCKVTAQG